MRKVKIFVMAAALSVVLNSCLGSYSAFNGLRSWNENVVDNKFVNNLLFWGLWIVPVYPLFIAGDTLIFNTIEFWSGSNPIAMNEGEIESQILVQEGNTIQMIATKNKMNISVIEGEKAGTSVELFYLPEEQSWNAKTTEGEIIKLSSMEEGLIYVYLPNGNRIQLDANLSTEEGMAIINSKMRQNANGVVAIK